MTQKNKNSWKEFFEKQKSKPYFAQLTEKLDTEYSTKEIFPPREQIFDAFEKCPLSNLRVVIIGQDPYHGAGQAHGLAFSVPRGAKIPPSLRNIFAELHADLGLEPPPHGNLESWAKQGVLLLNSSLTVESGRAGSHASLGWAELTAEVLDFLNNFESPLVFILWGNHAQKLGQKITNPRHLKIESAHPSPLSARRGFFGSRPFSKANHFLRGNDLSEIDWNIL